MLSKLKDRKGSNNIDRIKLIIELKEYFFNISNSSGFELSREEFANLSIKLNEIFIRSCTGRVTLCKAWYPMACANRGAFWFQDNKEIENPYFGKAMLKCGEIKEILR